MLKCALAIANAALHAPSCNMFRMWRGLPTASHTKGGFTVSEARHRPRTAHYVLVRARRPLCADSLQGAGAGDARFHP